MRYGSLFSGIGGFDKGFDDAGLSCAWQVEQDAACQRVLARHWPGVLHFDDMREVTGERLGTVDVICGGFPCQDVSVAGRRKGLAGERSGLWFEFHRLLGELTPRWVVIENVPGLLSSNSGRDFAIIIQGLVECGYGVAWRVLDAQYFGVAQRRRRVFIVGSLGSGDAAQILFESEGGSGDSPPRREARAGTATGFDGRTFSTSGAGFWRAGPGTLRARDDKDGEGARLIVGALDSMSGGPDDNSAQGWHLVPIAFDWQSGGDVRLNVSDRYTSALQANQTPAVTVALRGREGGGTAELGGPVATALRSSQGGGDKPHALIDTGVRRLTPTECERLQGFPDGWTEGESDSARYRMLGNAVAVPVARWIGRRLMEIEG